MPILVATFLYSIENCWGDLDTLKGAIVCSAVLLFSMWGERGGGGGGGGGSR